MPYFFLLLNIKKTIKGKEKGDALVLSPLTLCLTKFATKKKKNTLPSQLRLASSKLLPRHCTKSPLSSLSLSLSHYANLH